MFLCDDSTESCSLCLFSYVLYLWILSLNFLFFFFFFFSSPVISESIQRRFTLPSNDSSLRPFFFYFNFLAWGLYPIVPVFESHNFVEQGCGSFFRSFFFFSFSFYRLGKRDKFPCHLSLLTSEFSSSICFFWDFSIFRLYVVVVVLVWGGGSIFAQLQHLTFNSARPLKSKPLHYKDW